MRRLTLLALAALLVAACGGAPPATPNVRGPRLYDDFARADGPLVPRTSPSGHVWGYTGAVPPYIEGNRLTQQNPSLTGGMYATTDFGSPPSIVSGVVSFGAGKVGGQALAIATSKQNFPIGAPDLTHMEILPTHWAFSLRIGGDFPVNLEYLASRNYTTPIPTDGTPASIHMRFEEGKVTITDHEGVVTVVNDPRITQMHGRYVFWQTAWATATDAKPRWDSVGAED